MATHDDPHGGPEVTVYRASPPPDTPPPGDPTEPGPYDPMPSGLAAVPPGVVFRWALAATLGVLAVVAAVVAVYAVRQILVQVVIALFVAVSLDPAVRWLVHRGIRRSIAVAVIFLLALLLLAGFIWSVAPPLIQQAGNLAGDIPRYLKQLSEHSQTYRRLTDQYGLTSRITDFLGALPGRIGGDVFGFLRRFLGAVLNVLLVLVLTIYFLSDLPRLRRGLVRLFPRARRPQVAEVVDVVVDKVGGYMIGNLIISAFAGFSAFICLTAVRVPFALPLAVFVALTDLIPMVGATLGAVGSVLVALFTVDLWPRAIVVVIFFLAYQQVENYLIAPRVLRNTVDLSSVAVLLAALLGGAVLGLIGAVMAIPIVAAGKVLMTPIVKAQDQAGPKPGAPPPPASDTPSPESDQAPPPESGTGASPKAAHD